MFADDMLIYITGESCTELERKMNMVFNIVEDWINTNKLKMNVKKTKYMVDIRI